MAAKAFDCVLEHLRVLDVPAVGDHLGLWLLELAIHHQVSVVVCQEASEAASRLVLAPLRKRAGQRELLAAHQHGPMIAVVDWRRDWRSGRRSRTMAARWSEHLAACANWLRQAERMLVMAAGAANAATLR